VHHRKWDRGLFWDVNIGCTFDAPPLELIPGQTYDLTANFTHRVNEFTEGPRYSQQFSYNVGNPGIWLNSPEGMYAGNQFLYSPWHQDFTGENTKTWTLDVIEKGAPFYQAPGATWTLNAQWRGVACCTVTWTYEAREIPCDAANPTEAPCYPVVLEHILNAGIQAGWSHIRAYWYALEAKPPLTVTGEIIEGLTVMGQHLEACGFPFEDYDAPIDSLTAELRTGVRSLDIPEGIGSLIRDLQIQLQGKNCTLPGGEVVWLEHVLNAGIQAGWSHIRAYWYALEASPPFGGTSEIIEGLTVMGQHLKASGFPFERYDDVINRLIAELRTGVRSLDIPEGIGNLIRDVQIQLQGKTCNACGEDGIAPPPSPPPIPTVSPHSPQPVPCDIVGEWKWFNGGTVYISGDGTFEARGSDGTQATGTWRATGSMTYELTWSQGYVDNLTISADCQRLDGNNQGGVPVSGTRTGGDTPTPTHTATPTTAIPTSSATPSMSEVPASLVVDSRTVIPGGTVTVPVRLVNVRDVGSLNFDITYDSSVISIARVDKGSLLSGISFVVNPNETGVIQFGFATEDGVSGTGPIGYIICNAVGSAGSRTPLTISGVEATDSSGNPVTLQTFSGSVTIDSDRTIGDSNGDGVLTELDALAALRMSVNLMEEDLILDMDQDGRVTAKDALAILSIAVRGR